MIQQVHSVVPPITSPLKYSEARIMVRFMKKQDYYHKMMSMSIDVLMSVQRCGGPWKSLMQKNSFEFAKMNFESIVSQKEFEITNMNLK